MDGTKSILMVATSYARIDAQHPTGLWFEEFAVPYECFTAEGYLVGVASVKGGKVPIDPRSEPKDKDDLMVAGPLAALKHTPRLMDVDVSEYDAVFFPGGHGAMFDLPHTREVAALVVEYLEQGKIVAAVCHGPAALVSAHYRDGTPVVKGRRMTAFTDAEEAEVKLDKLMPFLLGSKLRELGANMEIAANWRDHVVVDETLITGQTPQSSRSTAVAVIKELTRP